VKGGEIEDDDLEFVYGFHQCQRGRFLALFCAWFQLADVGIGS